jgi:hypothetical protein
MEECWWSRVEKLLCETNLWRNHRLGGGPRPWGTSEAFGTITMAGRDHSIVSLFCRPVTGGVWEMKLYFWIRRICVLFGSVRCQFTFRHQAALVRCVPYLCPLLRIIISSSQVHGAEACCRSLWTHVGFFLCRRTPTPNCVWHVFC